MVGSPAVPFTVPLASATVNGQQALNLTTINPDFTYFDWAKPVYDSARFGAVLHTF